MQSELILAAARFLRAAAAMLAFGAFLYLALLVPPTLGRRIALRLDPAGRIAAAIVVAATLAMLPAEAAAIGDGWPDAAQPGLLATLLLRTGAGQALLLQFAAALLLAVAEAAPRDLRCGARTGTAGLVLASLAAGGHAAMDAGLAGIAHRLVDIVHLLSAGAWFGALVPVLAVLAALGEATDRAEAARALRAFSAAGHGAVALALLSGVANAAFILGWPSLPLTPYALLLGAKIAVVSAMTGLALVNRYRFVPRMAADPAGAVAAIRRGTLGEIGLGMAALALVAVFGMLDPG